MDTSMLNVDVQPTYVRCVIKDKVTQLHWPDEVMVDSCKIQRS
jgi:protein TilB